MPGSFMYQQFSICFGKNQYPPRKLLVVCWFHYETPWFLEVFEIHKTGNSLILIFQILETQQLFESLIFQIPGDCSCKKNQKAAPHCFLHPFLEKYTHTQGGARGVFILGHPTQRMLPQVFSDLKHQQKLSFETQILCHATGIMKNREERGERRFKK